jgi:hypothetical protein
MWRCFTTLLFTPLSLRILFEMPFTIDGFKISFLPTLELKSDNNIRKERRELFVFMSMGRKCLWTAKPPRHVSMKPRWNDINTEKPKNSEKILSQCHFIYHKPRMDWPGANSGLRGERPVSNRLSNGTATQEVHWTCSPLPHTNYSLHFILYL